MVKKPTVTETIGWTDYVGLGMHREWKKIEFPKEYYIGIWKQGLEVDQETDVKKKWGGDGRLVGGKGWKERVYNREERKKLLRTARNRCILHVPMEWMNEWISLNHHTKHCGGVVRILLQIMDNQTSNLNQETSFISVWANYQDKTASFYIP